NNITFHKARARFSVTFSIYNEEWGLLTSLNKCYGTADDPFSKVPEATRTKVCIYGPHGLRDTLVREERNKYFVDLRNIFNKSQVNSVPIGFSNPSSDRKNN
ncbi:unnamed protein product, partial [Heterotrigona itama]